MKKILLLLLLSVASGGATITSTDRGTGTDNSSSTSFSVVPTSTVVAGSTGVLVLAMDNPGGSTGNLAATSYTDSVGNVWYVRATGTGGGANAVAESAILTSRITTNFTSSNSLTITLTLASTAEAWTITELTPTAGNAITFVIGSGSASSNTGTPTTTSIEVSIGDCIVGYGAAESTDTWVGDGDSASGSWSTKQSVGIGSGATGISVISQTKVVSAYVVQTFDPTLTAVDVRVAIAIFTEADAKVRTTSGNGISEATTTISVGLPIASGSLGVLCISADNAAGTGNTLNFPATASDTEGNTWTLRQNQFFDNGAASAGIEFAIYTSVIVTPLAPPDTISWTYTGASVATKLWTVWEFAPQSAGTMSYVTGAAGSGATTASPTITTSSITSGDYVLGMIAVEGLNSFTADSDSDSGTWKMRAITGRGVVAGTGGIIISQWKLTTGTATQTYNPTLGTSYDTIAGWISIHETVGVGITPTSDFFLVF